jgi:hypothetical protein
MKLDFTVTQGTFTTPSEIQIRSNYPYEIHAAFYAKGENITKPVPYNDQRDCRVPGTYFASDQVSFWCKQKFLGDKEKYLQSTVVKPRQPDNFSLSRLAQQKLGW